MLLFVKYMNVHIFQETKESALLEFLKFFEFGVVEGSYEFPRLTNGF